MGLEAYVAVSAVLFALGVVCVFRRFGEQRVDPLTLGDRLRTDAQCGEVAVRGDVIERLFVQIICIQKHLQAGELLGE